jgi:hypothetical protein
MASLSDRAPTNATASPLRVLGPGIALVVLVLLGLRMMTAEETSFYRTHGMVADARTAVRLAQMVADADHRGCALPNDAAAQLQGDVWTVEARPAGGAVSCRVELDRKDGQILRVETPR